MSESEVAADERVEWLELFFDLVVVAAVAVLTEGLREDPTPEGLGLFVLLYAGIWLSWVSVVLYANVAGSATRTRVVVVAMFLVAVMAATAPIHFERRANAFALAFVVLRLFVARNALRTGRLLVGWPLLEFGGSSILWVVAMWVDVPVKYVLWAVVLVLDVVFVLVRGNRLDEQQVRRIEKHVADEEAERAARSRRTGSGGHDGRDGAKGRSPEHVEVRTVGVERSHLTERLGLFLIIVLGEAVSQLVVAGSTQEWTRELVRVAVAGFAVLVGLWGLTFSYGFTGAPHSRLAALEPRFGLPLHFLTTIGVIAFAAGLGEMASHPSEPLGDLVRWVMCSGLALHYLVMGVGGWSGGAPRRWVLGWALPCTAAPLVVAVTAGRVADERILWLFVATIVWMNLYGRWGQGRSAPATAP